MAKMLVCKECGRKYTLCNARYNASIIGGIPSWRTDYCDVPCYQEYIKKSIAQETKQVQPAKKRVVKKPAKIKDEVVKAESEIKNVYDNDSIYDKI